MSFVVDASVASCWYFEEPQSQSARALLNSGQRLTAPVLITTEVANVAWKRIRRNDVSDLNLLEILDDIGRSVQLLADASLLVDALEIAVSIDHPIYDCLYLAACRAVGARMVTCDLKLLAKLGRTAFKGMAVHVKDVAPHQGGVH